jgi:hypothetical protein
MTTVSFITNDDFKNEFQNELKNEFQNNNNNDGAGDDIDDIDFGIEEQNLAVIYDGNTKLEGNEKINPFFVGMRGGSIKSIQWGDIHRNYNSIIILTIDDKTKPNNLNKLFNYKINEDGLKDITGITFFRTGLEILRNKEHYFKTNIVSKNDLCELFPSSTFNESELVLGIFEMNEENTRKYCDMYKISENVDDITTKMDLYNYYLSDKKSTNIRNIFQNLKDTDYWINNKNLDINMTQTFVDREFNNQRTTTKTEFKVVSIRKENEVNYKNLLKNKNNSEYPVGEANLIEKQEQEKIQKTYVPIKSNFVDPSSVIRGNKNGKKRTFYTSSVNKISHAYMTDIFTNINSEQLQYDMLNNFLVSKDYCHLVANNKLILEHSKQLFDKYPHVFKYTFGYTWLTFYLEECLNRGKSTIDSRYTYDIHGASKLPVFPFTYSDIKQNPYLTVLIDDVELSQQNIYGLSFKDNYDGYGVADFDTFKHRFNIFMSGNPDIDPLKGLDWSTFAVSGSAIPACLQNRSILLDTFVKKSNNDETEGFKQFIKKYYNDSDVDLMSNETNLVKFLKSVETVYNLLKTNLNANDTDMKYELVKNFAISITNHFFEVYLDDFNKTYNMTITLEEFKKMSEEMIFKLYVYQKYIEVKNIMTKKILTPENIKNKFFTEYIIPYNYENMNIYIVDPDNYDNYNLQDSEIIYYLNDYGRSVPQKDNKMVVKFSEAVRFKLYCKNTKIETFRIKDRDFFGTVARFHFPCVRAYYKGDNVYMLPSCITAMMTGLNIEYKYFAGIRNPVDIINKYLQRGFGVLLNKFEINLFLEYNKTLPDNHPLKYKNDSDKDILIGKKNIKNKIFDINYDCELGKLIESNDDLKAYYNKFQKNSCVDCLKMTTINKNGNINKFKPSYVQLCYDEMN